MKFIIDFLQKIKMHISNSFFTDSSDEKSGGGSTLGAIKILRVFRVLRPLRAINRAKGLKVKLNSTTFFCHKLNFFIFVYFVACSSVCYCRSKNDMEYCTCDMSFAIHVCCNWCTIV